MGYGRLISILTIAVLLFPRLDNQDRVIDEIDVQKSILIIVEKSFRRFDNKQGPKLRSTADVFTNWPLRSGSDLTQRQGSESRFRGESSTALGSSTPARTQSSALANNCIPRLAWLSGDVCASTER